MDQGQRILQCLQHSVDTSDAGTIRAAEAQLALEAQQPGYGVILCHIALSASAAVPAHLRQLAAVLLKQYVKVGCYATNHLQRVTALHAPRSATNTS